MVCSCRHELLSVEHGSNHAMRHPVDCRNLHRHYYQRQRMYVNLQPNADCEPEPHLYDHRQHHHLFWKFDFLVCSRRHEFLPVEYRCHHPVRYADNCGNLHGDDHQCQWMYFHLQSDAHGESHSDLFNNRSFFCMCRRKRHLVRSCRIECLSME